MWNIIVGAIIGAVTSISTAIWIEWLRRPRLSLSMETPPLDIKWSGPKPAQEARYLRVRLFNKPLPAWIRWMDRGPALQCRAAITFHHLDGQNVFGRTMEGRWSASPEPVPMPVIGPDGKQSLLIDFARFTIASQLDVYPGETETLDVAIRLDDDAECYGWNNEAYFSDPLWRNLDWKLPPGRYLVRVLVSSSGQKNEKCFRLINDVARTDARLEPATRGDIGQISTRAALSSKS